MRSDFDKVWKYLCEEEQQECMSLFFTGLPQYGKDGLVVYMGSDAYDRLEEFKQRMIEKYGFHLKRDNELSKPAFPKPKSKYHR